MGVASSLLDDSEASQFASFIALKDIYDAEYADKIAAGDMTQSEALELMKKKAAELVEQRKIIREKSRESKFGVGDIVTAKDDEGNEIEGVIISLHHHDDHVTVDDGKKIHELSNDSITLKAAGSVIEVGDTVEIREADTGLRYQANVMEIAEDGKISAKFHGDDEEDIETGIDPSLVRKITTGRPLACMRWKKVINAVKAMRTFRLMAAGGHLANVVSSHSEHVNVNCLNRALDVRVVANVNCWSRVTHLMLRC